VDTPSSTPAPLRMDQSSRASIATPPSLEAIREGHRQLQDWIVKWCKQQHELFEEQCQLQQQAAGQQEIGPPPPPKPLAGFQSRGPTPPSSGLPEFDTRQFVGITPAPPMGYADIGEPDLSQNCSPSKTEVAVGSIPLASMGELAQWVRSDTGERLQPNLPNTVQAADGGLSTVQTWARMRSSDSVEKEEAREEWTRHLERRVSEVLSTQHSQRMRGVSSAFLGQRHGAWRSFLTSGGTQGTGPACRCFSRGRTLCVPVYRLVRSSSFQWCCTGVIVLNMLFIGYSTNSSMAHALAAPQGEDPAWFEQCNRAFTAFYCIELLVRFAGFGSQFFSGPDGRWHGFDVILVLSSLVAEIVQGVETIGLLRAIRVSRMLQMLRIIRMMRYIRDLWHMVCSIMQSLGSISWALLLLLIIMYLFTIAFMQAALMYLQETRTDEEFESIHDGIVLWYGSVFDTMYTLLASIVGGVDWADVIRPLEKISMFYRVLFSFYIVFVVIGVLNVLTGIFVERACELSGLDRDLVIQTQIKRNETFLIEMKRIFEEADADGSGSICWNEFKRYLENDRVKAYLAFQQLDAFDARSLFDILTEGKDAEMSIERFISGCQRLRGQAKSVDMVAALQETRSINSKLKALMRKMDSMRKLDSDHRSGAKVPTLESTLELSNSPDGFMRDLC